MKSIYAMSCAAVLAMSMSQVAIAASHSEKVVRSDRISFNEPMQVEAKKTQRVKRTDRIVFNKAALDQPSLQPQRVVRNDRVVFNKI